MAIPPEPLEEVLPQATAVIEAVVAEVVSTGPRPPQPHAPKGATSVPGKTPAQVVKLKVTRTLRGSVPAEIVVDKPEGDYVLSAGNKGPFLLQQKDPHPVILGRYGPDSWRLDRIEQAVKSAH